MIKENVSLKHLTTFVIEAKARYFAEYTSVKELERIMNTPEYQQHEVLHIGGGSNLLFVNDFNGLVLHSKVLGKLAYRKDEHTVYVIAGAGEKWDDIVRFSVDEGLSGLENLAGIPGEVGASAVQNVGAYGVEAGDVIFKVECYDRLAHKVVNFTNEQCKFGYRDSFFKHAGKGRYYVLRVCYKLHPSLTASNLRYGSLSKLVDILGHVPSPREVMQEVVSIRDSKLPNPDEIGSAGSFFKNPVVRRKYYEAEVLKHDKHVPCYELPDDMVKIPAGWLIEHAGLKGCNIGGAKVYEKQALVIVNTGNATGKSVEALCKHVQLTVNEKYGLWLTPEVNFIDTDIHVEILGSGTSKGIPEPGCSCHVCRSKDMRDKRQRACALVRTHGLTLLLDCSPDFRNQALKAGIHDIDACLLTHQHYDHVGGLDDLRPFCTNKKMPVYALKNVESDLQKRMDYCFRPVNYPGVPGFELHEVKEQPFYFRGLKIMPIHVMHASLPIVGYRIGDFAYVTDAKTISEEEKKKLTGLKVLVVNALRDTPHFSHFTLQEALDLISELKPDKAYLTHMCHDIGTHEELLSRLPANVKPAYDGLKFIVK